MSLTLLICYLDALPQDFTLLHNYVEKFTNSYYPHTPLSFSRSFPISLKYRCIHSKRNRLFLNSGETINQKRVSVAF